MKTVLFIEDNTDIRENMGEILELANYRVLLAPDGRQGVAMAFAEKPDIIICDIMMPELDGYGVIHLLQKNPDTQNIPFIFLTAKAERAELRKGMELGADDYITKPFSGTELLNAIEGRLKKADMIKTSVPQTGPATQTNTDLLQLFAAERDTNTFQKKQRVYTEGQKAFRLFYVETGSIKLFKTNNDGKDLIIDICQAGDFFGYTALLEGTNYKETAEVLDTAEISSITKDAFEMLINNNPDEMRRFIKLLAGNVHEKEEQLLGIAYNSLRKKVAEALMMLVRKQNNDQDISTLPIHISRDNLAAIAGTAKESLIRTLGDFRDEKLIDIKGSDIIVLQEKKLANMAN